MITINLDLPDGMYQVYKGELWKYEFNPPELGNGTKYVTINAVAEPKKYIAQDEELQHVGYSQEACGYEK